jgi:ribosomal protein L12E/L44/L45/RPP1/RPP2
MNFKAVAAAAASKPAPKPSAAAAAVKKPVHSYYREEMEDYDEEDVELEITDEDGGLNSRRAGDKSNW